MAVLITSKSFFSVRMSMISVCSGSVPSGFQTAPTLTSTGLSRSGSHSCSHVWNLGSRLVIQISTRAGRGIPASEQKVPPAHVPAGCQNECPDPRQRSLPTDLAAGVCTCAHARMHVCESEYMCVVCVCVCVYVCVHVYV